MEYNWVLFALGIGISLITLFFIYKSKDDSIEKVDLLFKELKDNRNRGTSPLSDDINKEILCKLEEINKEILELKAEVYQLTLESNNMTQSQKSKVGQNEQFSNMLHYNMFLEKNSKIIELYYLDKSPQEIAKLLNKSIREIEMVIGLIK